MIFLLRKSEITEPFAQRLLETAAKRISSVLKMRRKKRGRYLPLDSAHLEQAFQHHLDRFGPQALLKMGLLLRGSGDGQILPSDIHLVNMLPFSIIHHTTEKSTHGRQKARNFRIKEMRNRFQYLQGRIQEYDQDCSKAKEQISQYEKELEDVKKQISMRFETPKKPESFFSRFIPKFLRNAPADDNTDQKLNSRLKFLMPTIRDLKSHLQELQKNRRQILVRFHTNRLELHDEIEGEQDPSVSIDPEFLVTHADKLMQYHHLEKIIRRLQTGINLHKNEKVPFDDLAYELMGPALRGGVPVPAFAPQPTNIAELMEKYDVSSGTLYSGDPQKEMPKLEKVVDELKTQRDALKQDIDSTIRAKYPKMIGKEQAIIGHVQYLMRNYQMGGPLPFKKFTHAVPKDVEHHYHQLGQSEPDPNNPNNVIFRGLFGNYNQTQAKYNQSHHIMNWIYHFAPSVTSIPGNLLRYVYHGSRNSWKGFPDPMFFLKKGQNYGHGLYTNFYPFTPKSFSYQHLEHILREYPEKIKEQVINKLMKKLNLIRNDVVNLKTIKRLPIPSHFKFLSHDTDYENHPIVGQINDYFNELAERMGRPDLKHSFWEILQTALEPPSPQDGFESKEFHPFLDMPMTTNGPVTQNDEYHDTRHFKRIDPSELDPSATRPHDITYRLDPNPNVYKIVPIEGKKLPGHALFRAIKMTFQKFGATHSVSGPEDSTADNYISTRYRAPFRNGTHHATMLLSSLGYHGYRHMDPETVGQFTSNAAEGWRSPRPSPIGTTNLERFRSMCLFPSAITEIPRPQDVFQHVKNGVRSVVSLFPVAYRATQKRRTIRMDQPAPSSLRGLERPQLTFRRNAPTAPPPES